MIYLITKINNTSNSLIFEKWLLNEGLEFIFHFLGVPKRTLKIKLYFEKNDSLTQNFSSCKISLCHYKIKDF